MILLDLLKWALDNWENVTISGALLFIIRKLALGLIKREAMRIFNLQENEELSWTRSKVEMLTGEKYTPTHDAWKQVRRSYKKSLRLLPQVIDRVKRLRRKNMNNQINYVSLTVALLGAAKLVLQAFGIEITEQQVNDIANGVAAVLSVVGVLMTHRKQEKQIVVVQPVEGGSSNGFTYVPGSDK